MFWNSKDNFEQLEKAVRKAPSPTNYSELITQYQNAGKADKALSTANQAIYYFPDSEEICDLYYRIKKKQVQAQIDNLRYVIESNPTPVAYAQLAEIYGDLRDQDTALSLCRESIEKFPNDDATHLVIGEIRAERFYSDFQERNGKLAIESLEKACDINPQNYRALLCLSKLYLQIGAISKAIQKLKDILLFSPGDEIVEQLLKTANQIKKPAHEDQYILFQKIEQDGKLFMLLEDSKQTTIRPIDRPEVFEKPLNALNKVSSIICLLVCDRDGTLVAHHAKDGVDYNTCYEIAASIFQTIQESSRQMDIGQFQHSQIEGAFGVIHIVSLQEVVYIVFGFKEVKPLEVYKELQSFVSSVYKELYGFVA